MVEKKLKELHVIFITHTYATGFSQMFRDFTKEKVATFICIEHPLLPKLGTKTTISIYRNGKMVRKFSIPCIGNLWVLNYIFDTVISIMSGVFLIKTKADLSIGADNLNTLALLILKKLGKVKKVIYHTVDYTPYRFKNKILNSVYHAIDRYCCYHADMLWNSSARMNEGRVKNMAEEEKIAYTIVTPDGSNFDHKKRLIFKRIDRKKIVFLGHLREGMGLPLLILAFCEVVKEIPDGKLIIIGGGPLLETLKTLVRKQNLEYSVIFTGFLEKHEEVDELLKTGAIGAAPFEPSGESIEYYSDVGKPKAYLAAGMPVVITKVPDIAYEIEKENAGIVIQYNKDEMARAIIMLLKDDILYRKYRENAIRLSKKYVWSNIFRTAYKDTLKYFK